MNKIRLTLWFVLLIFYAKGQYTLGQKTKSDGTFIQSELVKNWSDKKWQQEYADLKSAGMHYLIFTSTINTSSNGNSYSVYPSKLPYIVWDGKKDVVDICLRNAAKMNFKVFIGLNFDEKWWTDIHNYAWITSQMLFGNKIAKELIDRYKNRYFSAFYGWYWPWEIDNLRTKNLYDQHKIAELLNISLDYLHSATPEMPFLFCPFFNDKIGSAAEACSIWTNIFSNSNFKKGDIFAPQDCIGAGGLALSELGAWFQALHFATATKPELAFWADTEVFDQRFWSSATLDRFIMQMNIVKPYVSNYITFAYSHYYSPNTNNPAYHVAYLQYLKKGSLPHKAVTTKIENITLFKKDSFILVKWSVFRRSKQDAGFYIYRDDSLIGNWQYKRERMPYEYNIATTSTAKTLRIAIEPYSVVGNRGKKFRINYHS